MTANAANDNVRPRPAPAPTRVALMQALWAVHTTRSADPRAATLALTRAAPRAPGWGRPALSAA